MAANRPHSSSIPEVLHGTNIPVVLTIAALIVGIAALLPLVQSSLATSTGGNISQLERAREDWQARLHEQEVRVAEMGSLDRIEQQAMVRLKMVQPKDVRYLSVDAAPPEPHRLPSRFLPPEHEQPQAGSSLWEEITGWLPLP